MPVDRDDLRDTAKYLRNVRPIDPEEITDYLEGQPDHRAVRVALREEAADLGLVEREDGAFVPVEDDPVRVHFDGVEALPNEYAFALEELLIERYGRDWHDGDSGASLRETIRKLKEDYYRRNPVEYDEEVALAYAIYHLPDYYATVQYVLDDLARDGLLTRDLRVLDVGAGVGGPALGLHDYLASSEDPVLVDYDAVEPSAAADVLDDLLDETGSNFHPSITRETAEAFEFEAGAYDLVCFNNVLSELDDPVAVVERYLDALADDGTFVATAPADKHTSTHLREVERTVEAHEAATVYGPTVRLWEGERPTDRGWSFDERPDLATPGFQERLARGASDPSSFTNTSVKFSYSFLRTDGERRFDVSLSEKRYAKMVDMGHHVPDRIDLVAAKLSRNLAGEGANPLFKISDGSEDVEHYAVLVKENALNRDLLDAEYGDLLVFEQVLALWNDDEEAYNLVCDEQTIVDVYAR
ncbi:small ribosomal subunit Rsm22 family protein [Halospeciosus flavus]|uniref:Small ribosomal subunit Rsm22 family protein n=1 Tax=Halospeciosus flavus TaxID=3032283 RepID=A0ABD5Z2C0_9EURY|nr:class I SAM-dependent methyltransferase [Halospeciosus flavus]